MVRLATSLPYSCASSTSSTDAAALVAGSLEILASPSARYWGLAFFLLDVISRNGNKMSPDFCQEQGKQLAVLARLQSWTPHALRLLLA